MPIASSTHPSFGREFMRFWLDSPFSGGKRKIIVPGIVAAFMHGLIFFAAVNLAKHISKDQKPGQMTSSSKVTLLPARSNGVAAPPKNSSSFPKKLRRNINPKPAFEASSTAPLVPIPRSEPSSPLAPELSQNNVPNSENAQIDEKPIESVAPQSVNRGLRKFLPSSSAAYLDNQRKVGETIGAGPIAGELEPTPTSETNDAFNTNAPGKTQKIVEREYSLAHYFAMLNARFSESWGPEQILPRETSFYGIVGENIDYDVVINRNGSLRKIVNVTARKQPWRDFRDVDAIVDKVFKNVFPLNDVPSRIAQDPVVIRKRIQYTGSRYSLF